MSMEVDMDTLRMESPAPWEVGALTDPIEVYDMVMVDETEAQDPVKANNKFEKRLIRLVRRHRELYDPAHKNFTNADVKVEVWEKIAKKLNSDADACKNAWVNLRYCYQKYVRRLRKFFANKISKKGKRRPTRPIMAYETDLIFLWPFIADRIPCPLPYDDANIELEKAQPSESAIEDDDLVMIEDDVEVIDLDDDASKLAIPFSRLLKGQFLITPEIRRLIVNIEPYEELYDCEHRYYEDYRRKGIIWNAIANEVGDKATKLMKCWIQIQTRYEWDVMQKNINGTAALTKPDSELEHLLSFFKPHILKMQATVYKSSYYLKLDWYEPIDHFKNIFSLLVAMKKYPNVITLTEGVATSFSSGKCMTVDDVYTKTWTDVAIAKGSGVTPGQCETTWLILRSFYWELVNMRKHSYQLQDKWYFESIISELYALAKLQQKPPQPKTKPTNDAAILTNTSTPPPPATAAAAATATTTATKPTAPSESVCNITIKLVESAKSSASNEKPQQQQKQKQQPQKIQPKAPAAVTPIANNNNSNTAQTTPQQIEQPKKQPLTTFVPTPVNFDEDKISSSRITLVTVPSIPKKTFSKSLLQNNNTNTSSATIISSNGGTNDATNTSTTNPNQDNLIVTLTKAQNKMITKIKPKDAKNPYPQSKSPQIRVRSQADLFSAPQQQQQQQPPQQPHLQQQQPQQQQQQQVQMLNQTHPQLQIKSQAPPSLMQVQQAIGQLKSMQYGNIAPPPQQQPQQLQQPLQQPLQQQQPQLTPMKLLQPPSVAQPFTIMSPNAVVQIPTSSLTHITQQTLSPQHQQPLLQQHLQQPLLQQPQQFSTPTNMGQLLPPVPIEPLRLPNPITPPTPTLSVTSTSSSLDTIKTPKIISAVSLAPRATFAAPFSNKGLQITAVTGGGGTVTASPPPPLVHSSGMVHIRPAAPPTMPQLTSPNSGAAASSQSTGSLSLLNPPQQNNVLNLPYTLPDNTNIMKCAAAPIININNAITTAQPPPQATNTLLPSAHAQPPPLSQAPPPPASHPHFSQAKTINTTQSSSSTSIEAKIPSNFLARPHVTPTAQLNPNEIMIELISSVNGNQLVVHGPPLERKYSLSMSTTALLIREVLSIPYLHKKDYNKPQQINIFWQYLAKRFNLPVHICKACWNFLSENFAHFPQIAPIEELTKPTKIGIKVWRESLAYFQLFNEKAAQLGLPAMKDSVEKFFDNIRMQAKTLPRIPGQKLQFVADWRAALDTSKDKLQNKLWFSTWSLFRNSFIKYMRDLELGIDNKWSLIWWRVLSKLDFLLEEQYHTMEPFYYIVRNKMIEECERCLKLENMRNATDNVKATVNAKKPKQSLQNNNSLLNSKIDDSILLKIPDVDPYRVIMAVRRYPQIYLKSTEEEKNRAWMAVAEELQANENTVRFGFQQALKNYRLYLARDPANRCRLNHRYYKHMAEICRAIKPKPTTNKLNIKTPTELNQTVNDVNLDAPEIVFPERFIMDINMSNSSSDLVMKNWAYGVAIAGVQGTKKLEDIFNKYRSTDVMILS